MSNRGPSAYQPNALPLGQTGSRPSDRPSTAVETAIAQCTSRWAMARGHRLNTSVVLAAVHGLSGLFRTVSAVEPSLFRPPPPPPPSPSLISHLVSVDVKQNGPTHCIPSYWDAIFFSLKERHRAYSTSVVHEMQFSAFNQLKDLDRAYDISS